MSDRRFSGGNSSSEDPPNSRLFIIGPKTLQEEDFRKAFEEYGEIEEIRVVRDRNTGDNKGVFYVKFAKTSQAARAMEGKNGKTLGSGRAIKIMVASSRDKGSKREENEEESLQRLFVVVPKNLTDDELYNAFKNLGEIDYASIIRDRETKESKGFAYVKFTKFSHAANAFEKCDRKFKPVFAEPRKSRNETMKPLGSNSGFRNGGRARSPAMGDPRCAPQPPDQYRDEGFTRLMVIASPLVNQDQMWKLFDVIPSMDYCQLRYEGDRDRPSRSVAEVVYMDPKWASYAQEKLHGFEYPPGFRLIIRPESDNSRSGGYGKRPLPSHSQSPSTSFTSTKPDILKIAETIAQASSLIQAAGLSPELLQQKLGLVTEAKKSEVFCSVRLPDQEPMANFDCETEARCFIVCMPSPLPGSVLKDVFCRFGNLIDVYMLTNRNCGYARYAMKQSAEDAIKTLHGAEVLGIRLKVIEAEERPEKRRKMDVDD